MAYVSRGHDYGNYTNMINYYINDLYSDSVKFYNNYFGDVHPTGTKELDKEKIVEFIGDIEDYLFYMYRVYNDNFLDVFMALSQKLKIISVLEPKYRGLYGAFFEDDALVMVSPVLSGSRNLNAKERTRLYVAHELGHIVNSFWVNDAKKRMEIDDDDSLVVNGISLLDEAITQNIAEDFAYCFANKDRPSMTLRKNLPRDGRYIFDGDFYKSNYDFYGELQEPAIMFARTLRGIGKIDDDSEAMQELCSRSLSYDFFANIAKEYVYDGRVDDLVHILENMGIIKNASYALFGNGNPKYITSSKNAKDNIISTTSRLKDTREPIVY